MPRDRVNNPAGGDEPGFVCRKKWLVIIKIDITNLAGINVNPYMDDVKKHLSKETFDNFFESDTLTIYIPVKSDSSIQIQEIILNDIGSDKYEFILKDKYIMTDNHIRVTELLSDLKEIINGCE